MNRPTSNGPVVYQMVNGQRRVLATYPTSRQGSQVADTWNCELSRDERAVGYIAACDKRTAKAWGLI